MFTLDESHCGCVVIKHVILSHCYKIQEILVLRQGQSTIRVAKLNSEHIKKLQEDIDMERMSHSLLKWKVSNSI